MYINSIFKIEHTFLVFSVELGQDHETFMHEFETISVGFSLDVDIDFIQFGLFEVCQLFREFLTDDFFEAFADLEVD